MTDLNAQDVQDMKAVFGRPILVPPEFKRWMADQFALAVPSLPMSQLVGGRTIERIIDIDTTTVSVTGTGDVTIYTLALPGKTIAKNGRLKIDIGATAADATRSHTSTMSVKVDGATQVAQPALINVTTPLAMKCGVVIWNRNAYDAQVFEAVHHNVTKGIAFTSLDLSVDHTLTITVTWGASGDGSDVFTKLNAIATVFNPEPAA